MTSDLTLLFLNAGRRNELIRTFRDALTALNVKGRIIASDINGLAPALYEADDRFLLPRSRDDGFVAQISELCRRERVSLIIPLIDPDLPILARNRQAIEACGTRILVSDINAIEICRDKFKTHEFLQTHGFPSPAVYGLDQAREHGFPLFIKPKDGSASQHTYKVQNRDDLEWLVRHVPDPIIQQFVEGDEITTDVFSSFAGEPIAAIPRKRLKVRSGEVSVGQVVRHAELESLCMKVARTLGTTGPINIQAFVSTRGIFINEINPRFGGGCPLSIKAGAPLPRWTLEMLLNRPLTPPGAITEGLTVMRFDDALYVPSNTLLT